MVKEKHMVTITTPRLCLREFELQDTLAVYAYESDLEVVRYVCYGASSEEESHARLASYIRQQNEPSRTIVHLAVVLKSEQQLIGWCGLDITNQDIREADLGYAINQAYWGKGYIPEAAHAVLDYSFTTLKMHRIFGTCHPANQNSARVMQKLGMRYEGCLREHKWCKGQWRDSLVYAILDHEWNTLQSRPEQSK